MLCSFERYEALVGLHENAIELRDFFTLGCNQINHRFEVIIGRWLVKRRRHFGANFRFFLQVSAFKARCFAFTRLEKNSTIRVNRYKTEPDKARTKRTFSNMVILHNCRGTIPQREVMPHWLINANRVDVVKR